MDRKPEQRNQLAKWLLAVADPIRVHILYALSRVQAATASDLASEAVASQQTLRRHLEALVDTGVLLEHPGETDGVTPGRPPCRFSLSPESGESIRQALHTSPR